MLNSKSFLAMDFGAGSLKLAEFEIAEGGTLRLKQYAVRSLGLEGSQEATREATMIKAIQEVLAEKGFAARQVNVCAPGFHVFSKFVKLPPVDTSKVTQIIQYEAQQNVPFPLEEVVWDYQILGSSATGELEVLLVAIKSDIVEGLFRVAESTSLRLQLVDVSPAALCNAFRYNYGDLEGCTMLLDIGAKTSNLLFFEKGKVYSRSINIGANSITQEFATESKLPFAEAEKTKVAQGFVSLGGAYEEPDNPQQAAISKIARQVMTRLHIQVNQTIQFYRGQQGGSAPQRLFLSGGASIMPYTAQFFAEKLNVPVEYFNPFRNIQIDPGIELESLSGVAHSFGEVVGLGLRNLAHCPVELNLMPKSSLRRQQFAQKKPYFIATVFSLVLVIFAIGWFYSKLAGIKARVVEDIQTKSQPLVQNDQRLSDALAANRRLEQTADQLTGWIENRFYWAEILTALRFALMETEVKTGGQGPTGVWVESFIPVLPDGSSAPIQSAPVSSASTSTDWRSSMSDEMKRRYGLMEPATKPVIAVEEAAPVPTGERPKATGTNEINTVNLVCRGINRSRLNTTANNDLAYAFARQLQSSTNFFDADTQLTGDIPPADPESPTFRFEVTLKLKRPYKL